jgi:hypothetical protein
VKIELDLSSLQATLFGSTEACVVSYLGLTYALGLTLLVVAGRTVGKDMQIDDKATLIGMFCLSPVVVPLVVVVGGGFWVLYRVAFGLDEPTSPTEV